ncbi:protein ALP1-like [Lactuca sativa]|uniref:protein ALP1-like n=1 Tax=Lactuca sativa TaxID=4236 RepID=UPI0022AECD45|nr:protein ALP1-like [Lactuca sativa]
MAECENLLTGYEPLAKQMVSIFVKVEYETLYVDKSKEHNGFMMTVVDASSFVRAEEGNVAIVLVYVDDLIVIGDWYEFFQLRYDARGRRGFTTLQKCVAAIRLMAMGESPDTMDDYMRMSERTARESLYTLSRGVVETFGDVYLRKPSLHDLQELYAAHEERHGFPGMIGSIDCTHWKCKNYLVAWKGQYASGHHGSPSLVLEAVASQDLWIWHAFFGVAGSNNDVNVLDQSPIFDDLLNGKAPDAPFKVNGNEYKYGYYLTDGIYPQYSTFVKAFRHPVEERDKFFKRRQEGARKDVERAFGVLKAKWHIVEHAARPLDLETLRYIMYACIIMHNMVVEDKGRNIAHYIPTEPRHVQFQPGTADYLHRVVDIQDANKHRQLREDLANHIFYGNNNDNE